MNKHFLYYSNCINLCQLRQSVDKCWQEKYNTRVI